MCFILIWNKITYHINFEGEIIIFRTAEIRDLEFILSLENSLFSIEKQSSKSSILRSLKSHMQTVLIQENNLIDVGCMIYFTHKNVFRIYSIAIDKEHQGNGYGKKFITYLIDLAIEKGKDILLEVDATNPQLIHFYEKMGFIYLKRLPDYYGPTVDGLKMVYKIDKFDSTIQNLIVLENDLPWLSDIDGVKVVSAIEYISNEKYSDYNGRIFNLCDTYKYQSMGYYVSLLAVARDNRVIPNVSTLKDFKNRSVLRSISDDVDDLIQQELEMVTFSKFSIKIYFGMVKDKKFQKIANELFQLFETPFLEIEFQKYDKWLVNKATPFSKTSIHQEEYDFVNECAKKYFGHRKHSIKTLKYYMYDLAILINEDELTPPSDRKALSLFKQAAEEIGFYVEFITKKDYRRILEFDALFIRETTNVNSHTYDFARYAYSEGLIVIDDPWSILKCSNKIYLYERLRKKDISMPRTFIINQSQFDIHEYSNIKYPLILKEPDSSFSKGVFKVSNPEEFFLKVKELFAKSQMIIAQEFIESDFDWRIGFLEDEPIYACKYYMVKNHWQIYDWKNKEKPDGDFEAIKISDIPKLVLETAQKAASSMGNGFYGVDLKEIKDKVYLIEVNDNPSIEYGVEDGIAGFGLYQKIMKYFFDNIEYERNKVRYVSECK